MLNMCNNMREISFQSYTKYTYAQYLCIQSYLLKLDQGQKKEKRLNTVPLSIYNAIFCMCIDGSYTLIYSNFMYRLLRNLFVIVGVKKLLNDVHTFVIEDNARVTSLKIFVTQLVFVGNFLDVSAGTGRDVLT